MTLLSLDSILLFFYLPRCVMSGLRSDNLLSNEYMMMMTTMFLSQLSQSRIIWTDKSWHTTQYIDTKSPIKPAKNFSKSYSRFGQVLKLNFSEMLQRDCFLQLSRGQSDGLGIRDSSGRPFTPLSLYNTTMQRSRPVWMSMWQQKHKLDDTDARL